MFDLRRALAEPVSPLRYRLCWKPDRVAVSDPADPPHSRNSRTGLPLMTLTPRSDAEPEHVSLLADRPPRGCSTPFAPAAPSKVGPCLLFPVHSPSPPQSSSETRSPPGGRPLLTPVTGGALWSASICDGGRCRSPPTVWASPPAVAGTCPEAGAPPPAATPRGSKRSCAPSPMS